MIIEYDGHRPKIAGDVFVAPNATIIGRVTIESGANIWFGAVLRGDEGEITIGPRVSVQDNVVIHAGPTTPTVVEAEVTIGHSVVLEGCLIKEQALIGMNATVLPGAVVGERALVAAGSVVRENQQIPPEVLAAGIPAQIKGPMSDAARHHVLTASADYQHMASNYKAMNLTRE